MWKNAHFPDLTPVPLRFEEEFDVGVRVAGTTRRSLRCEFTITRGETAIAIGTALDLPADVVEKLRGASERPT